MRAGLLAIVAAVSAHAASGNMRDTPLDSSWLFFRGDADGAENAAFNDSAWRRLDLPHDWSIEDLPPKPGTKDRIGPFDPAESTGQDRTGHTVGGTGWYRKHFAKPDGERAAVRFDGVYANSDVWLNGQHLGFHPHGYTGFEYDLTPHLKDGDNVLAVRVRNEGKNSRWYSGSGIYRHAWLTATGLVHIPTWGVFVTTPEVSEGAAKVRVQTEVRNDGKTETDAAVRVRLADPSGKSAGQGEMRVEKLKSGETRVVVQTIAVRAPALWSPAHPNLYTANVELLAAGAANDAVSVPFGVRKIEVDATRGFRLNGKPLKLEGACVHHDNGPLGAAAIDRAEERRVELLKANGFNAVRSAHNPPSPAFLAACDRLGVMVIDEAFDMWNRAKIGNEQDYHLYFKDHWTDDIAAMVRRDRNHPSVVFWSVGNEIPEQFEPGETGKQLREAVLRHDPTRPVTQAISTDWGRVIKNWDKLSDPAFPHLDVAGYNYLPDKYEGDHKRHPERVIVSTESFPKDLALYWDKVERLPYVIGDFVWTGMDYLGEAGLAHALPSNKKDSFFMPWPWVNAWCGDLDICGFKKAQSYYRDVVLRRSPVEMAVHAPLPEGTTEKISWWGWPDEARSWNWAGHEGTPLQVSVYSRAPEVQLVLNGKELGIKRTDGKFTAKFDVPYAPGTLVARAIDRGKVLGETKLVTTGAPAALRLTPDRASIRADRNDLSYVAVEVVDTKGQRVPDADIPVRFSVGGPGELAAQGSGIPNRPESFQKGLCSTYQGRAIAILRPTGEPGGIILEAEASGLPPATVRVRTAAN